MPHDDTVTVTDLFCGAGGSGLGATAVPDVELVMAANHSELAIETHAANFPDCDHDVADISQVRPERYRRSTILWASPECTWQSGARGHERDDLVQPDLFDPEPARNDVAERSRATMWDVPRFTEWHYYDAVIVENVVETVTKWPLWPAWVHAMECLGYRVRVVSLNSMHAPAIAAPRAPQSRDRIYAVCTRADAPGPDLEPRPESWCSRCERLVGGVQWWKRHPAPRAGKYRTQYLYRCPTCREVVAPLVTPAAAAIDWALPGQRIGDRQRPLSAKTLARIRTGLERYAQPLTFEARGHTYVRTDPEGRPRYARAWPVSQPTATLHTTESRALVVPSGGSWNEAATSVDEPMHTRTTRETDGLLVPAFAERGSVRPTGEPMGTQTTRHETALVVPYHRTGTAHTTDEPMPTMTTVDPAGVAFVAELRGDGSDARDVAEPLSTVTASGNHHMLVRNNGTRERGDGMMCTPVDEPARTITTAGHQSLVGWDEEPPEVEDCSYRMLAVDEIAAAMAFRRGYIVKGTKRDRVRQLGNAVTPPAAEWLIRAVVESLHPS